MKLKINNYISESYVDGPGIRFTVFTQGCIHNCPGCHNPQTHDFNKGIYLFYFDLCKPIHNTKYTYNTKYIYMYL